MSETGNVCPICCQRVNGDTQYFDFHVNKCLDRPASHSLDPASPSASKLLQATTSLDEICPMCQSSFTILKCFLSDEKQSHIQACATSNASPLRREASLRLEQNTCPVCDIPLNNLPAGEQQDHIQSSFLSHAEDRQSDMTIGKIDDSRMDTRPKYTTSLFPVLELLLNKAHEAGVSSSSILCNGQTMHFNVSFGDLGFGCGYRCFQMLYSAMRYLPAYRTHLGASSQKDLLPPIPTIKEAQIILEKAWAAGFDTTGKDHFGGRIEGRRKWIGTTELYTLFTYLGVQVRIIDFHAGASAPLNAMRWIRQYFTEETPQIKRKRMDDAFSTMMNSNANKCLRTDKQPLLLQHSGHSRVVVGIEEGVKDSALLVFDPSIQSKAKVIEAARNVERSEDPITGAKKVKLDGDSGTKAKVKTMLSPSRSANIDLSDHIKLLGVYRVSIKNLRKHTEYQILHVLPDGHYLSVQEKALYKQPFPSEVIK